jgi:Type III secretion basal body protein I, YscI, HrpB, PscI
MALATSPIVTPATDPVLIGQTQTQNLNPSSIPDQESVDAFEKAVQQPPGELRGSQLTPSEASQQTPAIGDAILGGLEKMRRDWPTGLERVTADLASQPTDLIGTSKALVKAQMDVAVLSMEQDLTSKVANQVGQGIQTLFRSQ